jgi:hypothetical protein
MIYEYVWNQEYEFVIQDRQIPVLASITCQRSRNPWVYGLPRWILACKDVLREAVATFHRAVALQPVNDGTLRLHGLETALSSVFKEQIGLQRQHIQSDQSCVGRRLPNTCGSFENWRSWICETCSSTSKALWYSQAWPNSRHIGRLVNNQASLMILGTHPASRRLEKNGIQPAQR